MVDAAGATAEIAKASITLGGFSKNVQSAALYTKILNGALGPFYNAWVSLKQGIGTTKEVLQDVSGVFEKSNEAMEPLAETVSLVSKGFKGIFSAVAMGIGLLLALGLGVVMLGGSMGELGDYLPGVGDGLSNILSGLKDIGASIMELVAVILTIDFSPIIEPLTTFAGAIIIYLVKIAETWVAITATIVEQVVKVYSHLAETGALQALVNAIGGVLDALIFAFGFIAKALADSGVTFASVTNFITSTIENFVNFLISSGIIDFIVEVALLIAEVAVVVIKVVGIIIGIVIYLLGVIIPLVTPLWLSFKLLMKVVITIFTFIVRTIIAIFRMIVAIVTGDFDKMKEIVFGWADAFIGTFESLVGFVKTWVNGILDFLSPLIDAIEFVVDGIGSVVGGAMDFLGFADGGIASGPTSGYPVELHGTEAVVPLPDGRTIPVTVKGMGGGSGGSTYNTTVNVSGGGNSREIASAVSEELERQFRRRSRGGYGRGVV